MSNDDAPTAIQADSEQRSAMSHYPRILSLDGGGIRGLSSLLILRTIMERIKLANHLSQTPKPCDYFDLIGGTSTGGLIAIMLGRLRLSVQECIDHYSDLCEKVFKVDQVVFGAIPFRDNQCRFDHKPLEQAVQQVVQKALDRDGIEEKLVDTRPDRIPTFVVATKQFAPKGTATIFRSYDCGIEYSADVCRIWEAARATSAAPTFFEPITIVHPKPPSSYVDGGLKHNNPSEIAIAEAEKIWPHVKRFVLVSIGTGKQGLGTIPKVVRTKSKVPVLGSLFKRAKSGLEALAAIGKLGVELSTASEEVHNRTYKTANGQDEYKRFPYFRFDVPNVDRIELQEWQKIEDLGGITASYTESNEVSMEIGRCVGVLSHPPAVEELTSMTDEITGPRVDVKSQYLPIFSLPYRRNPSFTPREGILETIHETLVLNAPSGLTSSFVIYGLGGVGKTQVAMEYCYQHRKEFDLILWLRADDYDTLLTSYVQLYQNETFRVFTGVKVSDETNFEAISNQVQSWFERCEDIKWLLVIDNADELDSSEGKPTLGKIIPRGYAGCVLVTSRNRAAVGQLAKDGMELSAMTESEATTFFQTCCKQTENTAEMAELLSDLGRLPLAIEQAGGFIRTHGISIAEYRKLYNKNKSKALDTGLSSTHKEEYYQKTVAATWNISFTAIEKKSPLASWILRMAGFLDGKEIPKEMFYDTEVTLNGEASIVTEWEAQEAFGIIMAYSLLQPVENRESISMHPLVQIVVREQTGGEKLNCFRQSVNLVERKYPWPTLSNLKTCLKYLSTAQNCVQLGEEMQVGELVYRIMECLAGYLKLTGQFNEALRRYQRALEIREREFGVDNVTSAETINNIGEVYRCQGKFNDAVSCYERALKLKEREFGADHIQSADMINNLGMVYYSQGKYDDAISCYERALKLYEQEFGADHIQSADTINNLGIVYDSQGKYDDAISCYERALKLYEREFGIDDIACASTLDNLGNVYSSLDRHDEAILLFQRALNIQEREFGVDHINSAGTINNLGAVHDEISRHDEALSYYQRALNIEEREFGVDHINSADTIMNIGIVYRRLNDLTRAKEFCTRGYSIFESTLGSDHPHTVRVRALLNKLEHVESGNDEVGLMRDEEGLQD